MFVDIGHLLLANITSHLDVLVHPLLVPEHVGVLGELLPADGAAAVPRGDEVRVGAPHVLREVVELVAAVLAAAPLRAARPQQLVDHPQVLRYVGVLLAAQLTQGPGLQVNHFVMSVEITCSIGSVTAEIAFIANFPSLALIIRLPDIFN